MPFRFSLVIPFLLSRSFWVRRNFGLTKTITEIRKAILKMTPIIVGTLKVQETD